MYKKHQHAYEPSGYERDQMLRLFMYGHILPYKGARPVVKRHMAADAGALEAYLAAISQSPVDMVIARYQSGVLSAFVRIDESL